LMTVYFVRDCVFCTLLFGHRKVTQGMFTYIPTLQERHLYPTNCLQIVLTNGHHVHVHVN